LPKYDLKRTNQVSSRPTTYLFISTWGEVEERVEKKSTSHNSSSEVLSRETGKHMGKKKTQKLSCCCLEIKKLL